MQNSLFTRRTLLVSSALVPCSLLPGRLWAAEAPADNPLARFQLAWTDQLKWQNAIDVTQQAGASWDEKLAAVQTKLAASGGGVAYFPAGEYRFADSIRLLEGVVLRGADLQGAVQAVASGFAPATRFEFPRYEPKLSGAGTAVATAFKGIYLADPARGSNTGVVNISLNRGHIHLGEGEGHACGANRVVVGCLLRNAAAADTAVPNAAAGQHAWQRFTARHHAAIDVQGSNLLIANNRLAKSGDDNFTQPDFVLKGRKGPETYEVVFDYDNRPGLYINHHCVGGAGGSGDDGTPDTHPYGFRKGIVIVDNFVFNTGRMGIGFCGDGVLCARNVTRVEKDVWRPTVTGREVTFGSSTNDNRAIEARGWRWVIENNECEVHRNWAADRKYLINDGEGIMHEDHCNATVRDSRLVGNKINSYLSIYKCGEIDGLLVEGNDVSVPGSIADIYVVANRNSGPQPCRNVRIVGNTTRSHGIYIAGAPAKNNVIEGNQHVGARGTIKNEAQATLAGNKNYDVGG